MNALKQIDKPVSLSQHGWLQCPICGFDYTHQEQVKDVSDPDHLEIGFTCEGCPSVLTLVIRQHKGNTHLEWFHDPAQEKELAAQAGGRRG